MPVGERIGQAYVRVILEGDDKAFLREFDRLGGKLDSRGKKWGKDFWEGFNEEGGVALKDLSKDIDKGFGRMFRQIENRAELANSGLREKLAKGLDEEFGRGIGERVFRGISERFATGGALSLERDLQRLHELTIKAVREEAQERDSAAAKRLRQTAEEIRQQQQSLRERERELNVLRQSVRELERFSIFIEKSGKNFITTRAEVEHFGDEIDRLRPALQRAFDEKVIGQPVFERLTNDLDVFQRTVDHTDVSMNRFRISSTRTSDVLGRAFGRGSRNDFINFMGALVRGFSLATARIVEFGGRIANIFIQGTKDGEGFFGSILGGFKALGARAAPLLRAVVSPKGLAALFLVLPVVVNLFGALTTAAISLGGALTAVGLAAGGALVGGLTILAGLILPIVAGIGGLTAAILTMDDAAKAAAKQAIKPFVDQMKELGKITRDEAFANLEANAKRLGKAFENPAFTNFAREIGKGLDEVQAKLVAAVESPKFANFFEQMGPRFRAQLTALTDVVINFGAALGGVFIAISPVVDRFLIRLQSVAREFNTWANSAGGQFALRDFFAKAEGALASIGRLTLEVGRAFAVMFRLGGGAAGVQIINDITQKIKQFVAFMRSNPDAVGRFFAGAVQIARDFGNIILAVVGVFRTLNTESRRNIAHIILQGIAKAIQAISAAIKFLDWTPIGILIDVLFAFEDAMRRTSALTSSMIGVMIQAFQGLNQLPKILGGGKFDPFIQSLKESKAAMDVLNTTKVDPAINLDGVFDFNTALGTATETISLTTEEMQALEKAFGVPLIPKVDVSPLETAQTKIAAVVTEAFRMNQAFSALPGQIGIIKTMADIMRGTSQLFAGGGVQVAIRPTVDPAALGTIKGQVTTALATTPAKVKPTLDPVGVGAIKTSLASLSAGVKPITINAGGNAQGVIQRTKAALDGLIAGARQITINAGGNAQAVIGRTKAALASLIGSRAALNISAGGNAQAVIGRTKAALAALMAAPSKINISAGGNAQAVIARTKAALASLPKTVTITVRVKTTGVKIGGIVSSIRSKYSDGMASGGITSLAAGGFANYRQYINPITIAGEAGKEAVVPLNRPLGQVDPSVRLLSAFAQGLLPLSGPTVNNNISVVSNSPDPVTVARQVLAHVTAAAY